MIQKNHELQYHWYQPRKASYESPSVYIGKVYGVYYTYNELDPHELFLKDYLEVGYLTRREMLDKLNLGGNEYVREG